MFVLFVYSLLILRFVGINSNLTFPEGTKPCVPTEKVEGACHVCVCGTDNVYHCVRRTKCIMELSVNAADDSLLELQPGETCQEGRMYKKDCNICQCTLMKELKCTTNACLKTALDEPKKVLSVKKQLDLPNLPAYPCEAGEFYKKGCRKCFCKHDKTAVCAATPAGPKCKLVIKSYHQATPDDYGVKTSAIDVSKLPALPNISTKCDPGHTYKVDCNICICLANGNLLCTAKYCLSIEDMNRMEAKRRTGLPCKTEEKDDECLKCTCVDEKLICEAVENCHTLSRRRQLHGTMPVEQPHRGLSLQKGQSCSPQAIYKIKCNKCYCQDDGSLRCTDMTCLNYVQAVKLLKLDMASTS